MVKTIRTSPFSRTLALIPPAVVLVAQQATAAFDTYLKIETIAGESTNATHTGWINLNSVQWGTGRAISSGAGTGGSREASAPSISEVTISKVVDSTSPHLFLDAVQGAPYSTDVKIELVNQATGSVFYRITLSDVMLSSQSFSAASGDDRAQESISLNFTKIKVEYFDAKGTLVYGAGWDLAKSTKF